MKNNSEISQQKLKVKVHPHKKILLETNNPTKYHTSQNVLIYKDIKYNNQYQLPHYMTPKKTIIQRNPNQKSNYPSTSTNINITINTPSAPHLIRSVTPNPQKKINREIINCSSSKRTLLKNQRSLTPIHINPLSGDSRKKKKSISSVQSVPLGNFSVNSRDRERNITTHKELQIILSLKKQIKLQNEAINKKDAELEKLRKNQLLLNYNELRIENEVLNNEIEKMKKLAEQQEMINSNGNKENQEEMMKLKKELSQIKENIMNISEKYKTEIAKNNNLKESIAYCQKEFNNKENDYKKNIENLKQVNTKIQQDFERIKEENSKTINEAKDTIGVLNTEKENLVSEIQLLNDNNKTLEEKNKELYEENEQKKEKNIKLENLLSTLNEAISKLKTEKLQREEEDVNKRKENIVVLNDELSLIQVAKNKIEYIQEQQCEIEISSEQSIKEDKVQSLQTMCLLSNEDKDDLLFLLSIYFSQMNISEEDINNLFIDTNINSIAERLCALINITDELLLQRLLFTLSFDNGASNDDAMKRAFNSLYKKSQETVPRPSLTNIISSIEPSRMKKIIDTCKFIDFEKENLVEYKILKNLFNNTLSFEDHQQRIDFSDIVETIIQEQVINKEKKHSIHKINYMILEKIFIITSHRTNKTDKDLSGGTISFAASPEVGPSKKNSKMSGCICLEPLTQELNEDNSLTKRVLTFEEVKEAIGNHLSRHNQDIYSLFNVKGDTISIEAFTNILIDNEIIHDVTVDDSSFEENLIHNGQIKIKEIYKLFYKEEDDNTLTKRFVDNLFNEAKEKLEKMNKSSKDDKAKEFIDELFHSVLEQRAAYYKQIDIANQANSLVDALFKRVMEDEEENGI